MHHTGEISFQSSPVSGHLRSYAMRTVPVERVRIVLLLLDLGGCIALSCLVFAIYGGAFDYPRAQMWSGIGFFTVTWLLASSSQGLYACPRLLDGRHQAMRAVRTCVIAFGLVLVLAFGANVIGTFSRVWVFAWVGLSLAWVVLVRLAWQARWQRMLADGACLQRALVLAGSEGDAVLIAERIERESGGLVRVVSSAALPGLPDALLPGALTLDAVCDLVRNGFADRVIIGGLAGQAYAAREAIAQLTRLAVDVTVLPNLAALGVNPVRMERIGAIPAIDVAVRPLSDLQAGLKRAEDIVLAGTALVLLAPVLGVVALVVKLDSPGPVFFRQKRVGFHGCRFTVWKFRSMHHALRDETGCTRTIRGDRRVTRVGRLLRRYSLDELPQLLNVLLGDMSLVGPRPHAIGMLTDGRRMDEVFEEYAARHRIRPGITGWAQVNGFRGEVDSPEKLRRRVALDLDYIRDWSLPLDLWILARTVAIMLFDRGAF